MPARFGCRHAHSLVTGTVCSRPVGPHDGHRLRRRDRPAGPPRHPLRPRQQRDPARGAQARLGQHLVRLLDAGGTVQARRRLRRDLPDVRRAVPRHLERGAADGRADRGLVPAQSSRSSTCSIPRSVTTTSRRSSAPSSATLPSASSRRSRTRTCSARTATSRARSRSACVTAQGQAPRGVERLHPARELRPDNPPEAAARGRIAAGARDQRAAADEQVRGGEAAAQAADRDEAARRSRRRRSSSPPRRRRRSWSCRRRPTRRSSRARRSSSSRSSTRSRRPKPRRFASSRS